MSIAFGVPFDLQLFLIDWQAQPLAQISPFPKVSVRLITGGPSDIFVNQPMSHDTTGTFYYSWTPGSIGQYRITYEYQFKSISRFFSEEIDVEIPSSGGSNVNSDVTLITVPDSDLIISALNTNIQATPIDVGEDAVEAVMVEVNEVSVIPVSEDL